MLWYTYGDISDEAALLYQNEFFIHMLAFHTLKVVVTLLHIIHVKHP